MGVRRAEIRQAAPLSDEHGEAGTQPQRYSRRGEEETERRRTVAMDRRGDLVQHAAGEAGTREMGMHLRHAERQVRGRPRMRALQLRYAAPQGRDARGFHSISMARKQILQPSRRRERNGVRPSVRHFVSVIGRAGGSDPIADLMPPGPLTPREEGAAPVWRGRKGFSLDRTHVKSGG